MRSLFGVGGRLRIIDSSTTLPNTVSACDMPSSSSEPVPSNTSKVPARVAKPKQVGSSFVVGLFLLLVGTGMGLLLREAGIIAVTSTGDSGDHSPSENPHIEDLHNHPEDDEHSHSEHDHSEDGATGAVFDVTIAAQETYGVQIAKMQLGAFTHAIRVPAFVRERPAVSNLQASCQLEGVIQKVFVRVGQSVREGDPLVELQLTGDELATAQSVLLDSVQQLSIIDSEIRRLEPAGREGGIARKNLIEKQYEKKRTQSVIESKRQELLIRGLSENEVEEIIDDQRLVRSVVIRVPTGIRPASPQRDDVKSADDWVYSVEEMHASPGSVLSAGDSVCDLSYHETLLVEGQAYERDLPLLTKLISEQTPVSVTLGEAATEQPITGRPILFMDNHLDEETQTYRFYVQLSNSVMTENMTDERRFRTWKFKPGQRGHVRLPQEEWTDRLILPSAAVAEDGVDQVIFQRVAEHNHFHGDEPPHSEFKRLVVKVDFRDDQTVVVDHQKQLKSRHYIAMNNADMLLRAMNDSAGGGHGHDHHGHEH